MTTAIEELRARAATETHEVIVPVEIRSEDDAGDVGITIRGHAAVFDRLSEDLGGFQERIARGAFRKALDRGDDVRLLMNHDPNLVLARTKSNTLDLREDPRGLHVYADAAPTSYAHDLRTLMVRGDVDQMSFGFTVARDEWVERDGKVIRTIYEIDRLFDVSVVTYPAYPQTSAQARVMTKQTVTGVQEPPGEELAATNADLADPGDTEPERDRDATGGGATPRRSLAERIARPHTGRMVRDAEEAHT